VKRSKDLFTTEGFREEVHHEDNKKQIPKEDQKTKNYKKQQKTTISPGQKTRERS